MTGALSFKWEASLRGARMLRTALGPAIAAWLEHPVVVEVMLNPDGRLWIERLTEGLADTLITGIRSDLPGQVTEQVIENVYDSPSGKYLLIPQGSKLIGVYDSQISFGQDRVLLVLTRLIMPNGRSLVLERESGADTQGVRWPRGAIAARARAARGGCVVNVRRPP